MQNVLSRAHATIAAGIVACVIAMGCARKEEQAVSLGPAPQKPTREEIGAFDDLTINLIMQGPGLIGTSPGDVMFSADGTRVFFRWNSPLRLDSLNAADPENAYEHYVELKDEAGTYALDPASGTVTRVGDDTADTLVPEERVWNSERTRAAEIRGGDLYLVDTERATTRRVTATLTREHDVHMPPSGDVVYLVRDDNLYSVAWPDGPMRQLTDLRLGDDPKAEELKPQRQWLVDQQKELFKDFKRKKEEESKIRPRPVYLGEGDAIGALVASSSGHYAAVEVTREPSGGREPLVPHFITESGYTETKTTRPKVGDEDDTSRVVLVDLEGDSLVVLDLDEASYVTVHGWSPTMDVLLVRAITPDYKRRTFFAVDPSRRDAGGKVEAIVLDEYRDSAWAGGPGFYDTGACAWLRDGTGVYFWSEEEGYSHLYTVTRDGTNRQRLTQGEWEVHWAVQSFDGHTWYLVTNEGDPGSRRVWAMDRDGTNRRLLTPEPGFYDPVLAPDEGRIALLCSRINSPAELYVYDGASGQTNGPFTTSTTELYRKFAWIAPETISIKASDGGSFRAQIFRPETFGKRSNHAGVVFIHGAGYLQNVQAGWSYYYREYMFNHLLALNGYTVLNVDFRGSAGYGRECRVAIHKHMGGRDLDDVIDGARYLVREEGVREGNVGVYGGSYGGFLTLMALFKHPDEIACGGAIRSVTDWAHYNHWYTSRILGLPQDDPEAYRRSSPIYFAEGFRGGLLMLHGLVDDNVLAQDILRLSERLIELGKEDWELALYPVESHAFIRADSWTDEYRRIFKLFERHLSENAGR